MYGEIVGKTYVYVCIICINKALKWTQNGRKRRKKINGFRKRIPLRSYVGTRALSASLERRPGCVRP